LSSNFLPSASASEATLPAAAACSNRACASSLPVSDAATRLPSRQSAKSVTVASSGSGNENVASSGAGWSLTITSSIVVRATPPSMATRTLAYAIRSVDAAPDGAAAGGSSATNDDVAVIAWAWAGGGAAVAPGTVAAAAVSDASPLHAAAPSDAPSATYSDAHGARPKARARQTAARAAMICDDHGVVASRRARARRAGDADLLMTCSRWGPGRTGRRAQPA